MSSKRALTANDDDAKKQKVDIDGHAHHKAWESFGDFEFVKVLNDDAQLKMMCLHAKLHPGSTAKADDAVVVLEKTPFAKDDTAVQALLSSSTKLKQVFNNDIYGRYECMPTENGMILKDLYCMYISIRDIILPLLFSVALKATIIYPATKKHLDKYTGHDGDIIYETADDYSTITKPWIESSSFDMQVRLSHNTNCACEATLGLSNQW